MSIALDPSYSKAYHRRGTARLNLGKLDEARRDFEELLRIEPNSKLAQIELNKIEIALLSNNLVFPVIKSESERSKKPLIRIKIEDINSGEMSAERAKIKEDLALIQQKIKLSEKDEKMFALGEEKNYVEKVSSIPLEKKVAEIKLDQVRLNQPKTIPERPTNGYQFKKDWQYLSDSLESLSSYLKVR